MDWTQGEWTGTLSIYQLVSVVGEVILFTSARQRSPHLVGNCTGCQQFDKSSQIIQI